MKFVANSDLRKIIELRGSLAVSVIALSAGAYAHYVRPMPGYMDISSYL